MTKHIEFHSIDEFMIELCSETEVTFDFGEFINSGSHAQIYRGPYEVIPTWQNQTLQTRDKMMEDNVLIYDIPLSETSNPEGGLTLNIGG